MLLALCLFIWYGAALDRFGPVSFQVVRGLSCAPNKSLNRSGGSLFRINIGPALLE
jgi:hypothetical protein